MRSTLPTFIAAAALLVVSTSVTPRLEAQGLTVRLAPTASSVRWARDVGLQNDGFYGGGLAVGFGRFVFLNGSYQFANSLGTRLSRTNYDGGAAEENTLDASMMSTGVELRIGDGQFAPIVTGSGGILDLSPSGRDGVKQVFVGYGAGLDARIRPWLNGQLVVQDMRFRVDRSTLAGDSQGNGVASDPERSELRRSTTITLGLGARLGGGRVSGTADALDRDMTRAYRGDGLMVRAELVGGVLRFEDALLLSERPLFGLRAGLDFGPFFGLRGSFARGAQRDLAGFVGMNAWSGEAQFNLGRPTDVSPHLLLGYGQISFESDFLDGSGNVPDDQNALIIGAGLGIPLNSRTQFVVALRDYMTTVGEISGVSTPGDVRHNFGLTAGFSFLLRGAPRQPGGAAPIVPTPPVSTTAASAGGSLEGAAATASADTTGARAASAADSVAASAQANYQSDRAVSIPLPTQGELFIRYGPPPAQPTTIPGAVAPTPDTTQAAARQALSGADLAELERRLAARMDSVAARAAAGAAPSTAQPAGTSAEIAALTRQVEELARLVRESGLRGSQTTVVPVPAGVDTEVVTEMRDPFFQGLELRIGGTTVRDTGPGAGIALDALFGDRILGPLQPYLGVHLSQVGVDGTLGGSPYSGSVTSYGMGGGIRLGLPRVRSVRPSLNLGVSGVAGGTRGDSPGDATIVDDLYGGFVMGPRVALTGAWRRAPASNLYVVGSIARLWAGSRGGWTFQAGVRWSRPSRERTFVRPVGGGSGAPARSPAPTPRPDTTIADPAPAAAPDTAAVAPVDTELTRRVQQLEEALAQEREARQRLEAAADSATIASRQAAEASRAAEARADSLAAAEARAEREREAERAAASGALESRLQALVGVLPGVQRVRRTTRGVEVVLGGSLFPTSATELGPESRPQVARVAAIVSSGPYTAITVTGHTDSTGSDETNRIISRLRAEAVRRVLVEGGIEPSDIEIQAAGEDSPVAPNETADGRRQNRRVEILIEGASP